VLTRVRKLVINDIKLKFNKQYPVYNIPNIVYSIG